MTADVALALAAVALLVELVAVVVLVRVARQFRRMSPFAALSSFGSSSTSMLASSGIVPQPVDDEGAPPLVDEELASS